MVQRITRVLEFPKHYGRRRTVARFSAYEIHPVVCYRVPGEGSTVSEQADNIEEAASIAEYTGGHVTWNLYGIIDGDGQQVISAALEEADALDMLYRISGIAGTPGNPGPYLVEGV